MAIRLRSAECRITLRQRTSRGAAATAIKSARDGGASHTAPLPLRQTENAQAAPTVSDESERENSLDSTTAFAGATLTPINDWLWQGDACAAQLCEQFGALSLDGYGLEGKAEAVR